MDTLEFLGGKYQGGEQILPGVIQTYRALEVSTGRSVFVHRVASNDDPDEQLVLYRLLSAALVRSPAVRSMILDMRDDTHDWFVVTETAPQCLLLREWLQFELDNAAKPIEAEKEKKNLPAVPASIEPSVKPVIPAKTVDEPGEFTRFFKGGLPTPAPAKSTNTERPSRTGIVQRPNTPMPFVPPVPARKDEPGEFTKLFNKPLGGESASMPMPGAQQSAKDFDNLFGPKAENAMPMPVATPTPGEYTRIFGKSNVPPPVQPPAALGERARTDLDDPLSLAGPQRAPSPLAVPSAGPSEYTRVTGGNRPATAAPEAAPNAGAPVSANVSLPPGFMPPPMPHAPPMPHVAVPMVPGVATPHLPPPPLAPVLPPASVPAAGIPAPAPPSNQKLFIFLGVLGVLAVLLILMVFLALRK